MEENTFQPLSEITQTYQIPPLPPTPPLTGKHIELRNMDLNLDIQAIGFYKVR